MDKVKIGVLGYGVIAQSTYMPALSKMPNAEVVAICDIVPERAQDCAARYNIPQVYYDLDDMLAKSDIDLMVNLTHIQAHFETNLKALQAGKHVYSEKTMTTTVAEATILIEEAKKQGVRLGAAAAMMLNPAVIKAKELIQAGAIGKVAYIVAHHSHGGAASFENWTTDPTWFYKPGAGPLYDMGVYALHTITGLLGPAKSVCGMSGIAIPQRKVRSGPVAGKVIDVEVDDNTLMIMNFGESSFAFLDCTYCAFGHRGPRTQIFGSEGTINFNDYGAPTPLSVYRDDWDLGLKGWTDIDLGRGAQWSLPSGVEHLVECILDPSKEVIVSGEHARHVIEIMNKCTDAAHNGVTLPLETVF
ncbi:MAG: Gfo/Idh/MocA family oxidoreductase [Chloroflexi bacterium]|nr:Gfo/Idh/MocA family oxidoreductase [Chloroflexota bacterium]